MHYRKLGSGPAIVLLHGFPESGTLWRGIWDALAARYTVIIPDLPGSGQTPLEKHTSINEMAVAVKELLDKEGIGKAVIVGHSMGGYTALAFARDYPKNVAGLSLVHSSPLPDDDEKKMNRKKVMEVVRKGARAAFLAQMVPGLFSPVFKQNKPELVEEQVTNALDMSTESIINFYTAMMERADTTAVLDNAPFPLQWILGEDDTVVVKAKLLPYCAVAPVNFVSIYEGCGHMSMIEAPGRLTEDLNTFADYCYQV